MIESDPTQSHQVWTPEDPGFRRAIDSAGSIAAPLLAGFSFTLLVLLLPSLNALPTATTPTRVQTTSSQPFSGAPGLAAVLLLTAGVLLIAAVQAAISLRRHAATPSELEEWWPHYFRESDTPGIEQDDVDANGNPIAMPNFWAAEEWDYRRIGRRWYGAQARHHLYVEVRRANVWANWTRALYHCGVLALLGGLTALVCPPAGGWDLWHILMVVVGGTATLGECGWIVAMSWPSKPGHSSGHPAPVAEELLKRSGAG